ncbi:MAG TPA: hypothetical protein VFZ61_33635, partial [Polyangiales bacterium]
GVAIGRLVDAVSAAFLAAEPALLAGGVVPELCSEVPYGAELKAAKQLAAERIYRAPSVVERLLGGQRVLHALLEELCVVVPALAAVGYDRAQLRGSPASVAHLLGDAYRPTDAYAALLGLTDFLCSLTDRSALALSRRLRGA